MKEQNNLPDWARENGYWEATDSNGDVWGHKREPDKDHNFNEWFFGGPRFYIGNKGIAKNWRDSLKWIPPEHDRDKAVDSANRARQNEVKHIMELATDEIQDMLLSTPIGEASIKWGDIHDILNKAFGNTTTPADSNGSAPPDVYADVENVGRCLKKIYRLAEDIGASPFKSTVKSTEAPQIVDLCTHAGDMIQRIMSTESSADSNGSGVPDTWRPTPIEPTEEMWSGLARDLMMWIDGSGGRPTGKKLYEHLDALGVDAPTWLRNEIPDIDHVPPKGTRATVIYKAMLAAAPFRYCPECLEDPCPVGLGKDQIATTPTKSEVSDETAPS